MPRSLNRHPVEIPTELYDVLAEQARRDGRPVASVVVDLITDGLDAQEGYGRLAGEIAELRRMIEALRLALENRLPPWRLPEE